ncbi:MAG: hypothetical protein IPG07_05590 [Crocinitomicaceae bacterium]|nr:hypothetical protein [Crocinitomicaceae bacterium]
MKGAWYTIYSFGFGIITSPKSDEVNPTILEFNNLLCICHWCNPTQKLQTIKLFQFFKKLNQPFVLLGGEGDFDNGELIAKACRNAIKLCGRLNLNQSAVGSKTMHQIGDTRYGHQYIASSFRKQNHFYLGKYRSGFWNVPYMP